MSTNGLVIAAFVFALVLTILSVRSVPKLNWVGRMGAPKWDLKESWASTLTAVGAILATALSTPALLPKESAGISKSEFSSLSLLFATLTIIGAFTYNATRRAKVTHSEVGVNQVQYQGYVWSFTVATIMTLWAVSGQLMTLFLLLWNLSLQGSMSSFVAVVFQLLLVMVFVGLVPYTWQCVRIAIQTGDPNLPLQRMLATSQVLGFTGSPRPTDPPLPEWSIL